MIYLIDKETNSVINTYNNVISWGNNFVEFRVSGLRSKIYCQETEYFTDVNPEDNVKGDSNGQ